jgi:flagellar motility protein MotE (MotC chaperone)
MLAKTHPEIEGAARHFRRRSLFKVIGDIIFEYEDARRVRAGRDAYAREQGRQEAEAKFQEQLTAKEEQLTTQKEQLTAKEEQIRQLEEENRRLRSS